MRIQNTAKILAVFVLFITLGSIAALAAGTIKMRIVMVNPSTSKTQTKSIKTYLPKEITLKNIKDAGGLDIDYDQDQGLFFAYKDKVELAPSETKTFELVMEDVWFVSEDQIGKLRVRTEKILEKLKDTVYFNQADLIAKTIYGRLEDVLKTQSDVAASKQQHIAYYRDNLRVLEAVKVDIDKLERILVAVGGAPNIDLIEQSELNLKSPSSKTTWVVIFAVLIFVAVLSATFYFTWMKRGRMTEDIFTKEKDVVFGDFKAPSSEGESEKENQEQKTP